VAADTLPFVTRLWFAWLCFIRILFDGRFALRAWNAGNASELPAHPHVPLQPRVPVLADEGRGATAAVTSSHEDEMTPALQLLSLLQREGRFVDFLQQDIASFPDADVGVAARVVHEGCRRALRAHATVEPVRAEVEGAHVTLPAGFDADAVKLVGDVKGDPPYAGVLRHRGWRASKIDLPQTVGVHDERILAPAEVELG
jgi:hypothetical protein